ncbi:MAG: hypothetical protein AB7D38_11935 [Sulfurimonas sp.]|uniref:hypothetical protein n=1 Tax=Sulfurimonas sp. TaxID=2022749 RepID=UPI003D0DB66E
MKTQTLEYNKETGQITICEYDEGFLVSSNNITTAVMTLALEKLYDDYDLDIGDEVVITKKKSLEKVTKLQVKK